MFPITGLRLLLPAILPSWRFFDAVTASPRVDYALLTEPEEIAAQWQEFRPRPAMLTMGTMLRRLFWNPAWNESLFLVSLAERLMSATTEEAENRNRDELLLRVARDIDRHTVCDPRLWLQIRLRFVRRTGRTEQVESEIVYLSSPRPMADLITP